MTYFGKKAVCFVNPCGSTSMAHLRSKNIPLINMVSTFVCFGICFFALNASHLYTAENEKEKKFRSLSAFITLGKWSSSRFTTHLDEDLVNMGNTGLLFRKETTITAFGYILIPSSCLSVLFSYKQFFKGLSR